MWTRASRRVPRDLKVVLIPRCLHHSLDSFTYSFDIGEVEGGLVLCFGGRGFVVFPEGADNHLCGIAVGLEDSFQVLALLRQFGGVTDLLCSGC